MATVVTSLTLHMRRMFARFLVIMILDATHGTNAMNYKLFSFTTVVAFGDSLFVHHSFPRNERMETLTTAVEQLKRAYPSWEKVQSVAVDKAFGEITVLPE